MSYAVAAEGMYWCDYRAGFPWTSDPAKALRYPSLAAAQAVADHWRRRGLAPGQKGDPASRLPVTLGGRTCDLAQAVSL